MTLPSTRPTPVILCILDGWGHRLETENNAIALADTPTWDRLIATCPHALVETSGLDVGLPHGQMGNSEVGHMNIGAGRVMLQDLPRIDAAVADGSLAQKDELNTFLDGLQQSGGTCHLMGLLSPGGVHSHQDHLVALAQAASAKEVPVAIHAFMDGRDTPPKSGAEAITKFQADIEGLPGVSIATVTGRYYAMDRDQRWERVEKAYEAIASGTGAQFSDPVAAVEASYADDVTDEFMLPHVRDGFTGMADGDGVLMANFRADRAREVLAALLDPEFNGFDRTPLSLSAALGMVDYGSALSPFMTTLFEAEAPENTLGQVIADAGLSQMRIAETEKYAHVTFFLNGGVETEFTGEERTLIPSPKVATYDLQPAMSAVEVTDAIVASIKANAHDVIIVNYANGDMVGHTGVLDAAIEAAATIDLCLSRLEKAVDASGGSLLITADHGNCEQMVDPQNGGPHTQHTVGVVPAVLVNAPAEVTDLADGKLADIAPTVLQLLGLKQPADMTGTPLVVLDDALPARVSA